MIEFVDAGIVVGSMLLGYILGWSNLRTETVEKVVEVQTCLYCKTNLVGESELDRINHLLCRDRSPEQIAEMLKEQREKKPEFRWFVDIQPEWASTVTNPKYWEYDLDHSLWRRYEWKIFLNGQEVSKGKAKTAGGAKGYANKALALEKHKVGDE